MPYGTESKSAWFHGVTARHRCHMKALGSTGHCHQKIHSIGLDVCHHEELWLHFIQTGSYRGKSGKQIWIWWQWHDRRRRRPIFHSRFCSLLQWLPLCSNLLQTRLSDHNSAGQHNNKNDQKHCNGPFGTLYKNKFYHEGDSQCSCPQYEAEPTAPNTWKKDRLLRAPVPQTGKNVHMQVSLTHIGIRLNCRIKAVSTQGHTVQASLTQNWPQKLHRSTFATQSHAVTNKRETPSTGRRPNELNSDWQALN